MNIQRWKGMVWLGSLAVGGFLVFYVYDFLRKKEALAEEIPDEVLVAVLDGVKKPEEHKSDVVDLDAMKRVFFTHDWTGKEKEKPVAPTPGGGPVVVPKVAVGTLLKVLAIKVDLSRPEKSVAYVKFVEPKLAVHVEKEDVILRPDERLFAPFQDVRVKNITGKGVVFAFDDEARGEETVTTSPYLAMRGELGIVMVGPEGAILPQVQKQIDSASPELAPWNPEQLTQVRKNEFQVGTETLKELDRDYSRILSRDIDYQTWKNPRTGASDGIKINRVVPGSIPDQAGLTEGEVLKSINGHKVTSVNDAIAFVKANANGTQEWVAVFEKQGREFTRTYRSPR
jgi:PDZ domain-containing protein